MAGRNCRARVGRTSSFAPLLWLPEACGGVAGVLSPLCPPFSGPKDPPLPRDSSPQPGELVQINNLVIARMYCYGAPTLRTVAEDGGGKVGAIYYFF